MIRLVGAGLMFSSTAYLALRMIQTEKKKIERISAYVNIVSYVKNQIDLYSLPIEKILKSIDPSALEVLGMEAAPDRFEELILLDGVMEETQKTLREFSFSLGKSYREMQIKLCEKALGELERQKITLATAFPARKKTILALSFGICGMAVIALI
jgi:hypothetical protein